MLLAQVGVANNGLHVLTEFQQWKTDEEEATLSQFVRSRGETRTRRTQLTCRSYYCQRSGRYIGKDGRLRHLKIQGSCKTGRFCPAAIFAKILTDGIRFSCYAVKRRAVRKHWYVPTPDQKPRLCAQDNAF